MKRVWLRGILLGVSLALLLASGVALAKGLSFTADKNCVRCALPGEPLTDDEHIQFVLTGWNTGYDLCDEISFNGQGFGPRCWDHNDPQTWWWRDDPSYEPGLTWRCDPGYPEVGEWGWRWWQVETGQSSEVIYHVVVDLADCPVEEQFVPEPATLMLLGSGLAGLSGYVALRRKARQ